MCRDTEVGRLLNDSCNYLNSIKNQKNEIYFKEIMEYM